MVVELALCRIVNMQRMIVMVVVIHRLGMRYQVLNFLHLPGLSHGRHPDQCLP